MISSKKELRFYLKADLMMNRGCFKLSFKEHLKRLLVPDLIMRYLISLRYYDWYVSRSGAGIMNPLCLYHIRRYHKLGARLGFSIGISSIGYGIVIPHYGTIVIGPTNHIGNFSVLHTSICITDHGSKIGDAFYCSTGAKVVSQISLGDNITLGANCVVNRIESNINNVMIAGVPARKIKEAQAWYDRDGVEYQRRVNSVLCLKELMKI